MQMTLFDIINLVFYGSLGALFVILYVVYTVREHRANKEEVPGIFATKEERMAYVLKSTGYQTHPVNKEKLKTDTP